jgi:hypothetical protein
MNGAGDLVTVILIVLLVLAVNIVWAIGLATDYRASRYGWLFAGILVPFVGIVRGFLAMWQARRR